MALRRPYIREATAYIPAPTGGWAPDVSPGIMAANQAPILDNLVPQNGYVRMRGAISVTDDFTTSSTKLGSVARNAIVQEKFGHFQVFITQAARTLSDYVDPWFAVRAKAVTGTGGVSAVNTSLIYRDGSGTHGSTALSSDNTPGPRFIAFGSQFYGLSYSASTAPTTATLPDGSLNLRNTNLLTWALGTYSGAGAPPPPTAFPTQAPRGMVDLKVHLNRIWLLGGVDVPAGTTTNSPTKIFYTNVGTGGTLGTVLADWRDSVTGNTNQFELDQDYNDPGVGLAVWRNQLIIFRDRSVWVVQGTTSQTFQAKRISQDVGCLDQKSIVETDNGVYFLSQRGLMYTDGTTIRNVSGPVQKSLQQACNYTFQQTIFLGGWAEIVPLQDGLLWVTLGNLGSISTPDAAPAWNGVYNPNTGTWFRITSQVFTDNISSGDSNLYPSHLFTPISPRSSAVFHLANFKMSVVESGGTNIISGQFPRGDGLYDHDTGGNRPIIPAKWRSRDLFGPEAPRTHAGVRQMFLDHTFPGDTNFGFTGVTTGWHVNLIDMSGNTLPGASFDSKIGQSSLLVDLTLRARPSIMRDYSWDFDESDDASFEVSWAGSNQGPGGGASERLYDIFGVGLTFLPGAREPLP